MLTCDLCGTPLPPSAARYGCTPCDYDLCEKCGEGGSIIPAGEKYVGYRETIPRRAAATAAAAATAVPVGHALLAERNGERAGQRRRWQCSEMRC